MAQKEELPASQRRQLQQSEPTGSDSLLLYHEREEKAMMESRLHECCETVIAAMASHIQSLECELNWKQKRIDQLERENEAMRAHLGEDKQPKRPSDMLFKATDLYTDTDNDPFEGGDGK